MVGIKPVTETYLLTEKLGMKNIAEVISLGRVTV